VRRRLDRIIATIEAIESTLEQSPFERLLRVMTAEGRLDPTTRDLLLEAHHKEVKE
jgi:hypothetical protein